MVWCSPLRRIFSKSFCLLHRCLQSNMLYGEKMGRLVKKYMRVEPTSKRRWSGRMSVPSSLGSSRFGGSECDYWDEDVAPAGVPEGCLAVYVGPEMRRFVIQASFLYNHAFRELLRKSEEEYGFETEGGLRIPCEPEVFEKLLWQLETGGSTDKSFSMIPNL